ncbi:hypothetical protein GCM10018952_42770 [Streptosporangium vulgare]
MTFSSGGTFSASAALASPDAGPELEDVALTEPLAKDLDDALGGEQHRPDHLQQRRLPGTVGTDDDPPLVLVNGPVDLPQQGRSVPADGDVL